MHTDVFPSHTPPAGSSIASKSDHFVATNAINSYILKEYLLLGIAPYNQNHYICDIMSAISEFHFPDVIFEI